MKVFRIIAVMALLTPSAYAQTPELIQSFDSKTPQQKADDELREKFSKEKDAPKKIPEADAKTSVDPWGVVRSGTAAKTATTKTAATKTANSKTSNSATATSVKPRTKTGTDTD